MQIRHNSAVQAVVEKYKQPTPEEHIAATAIQRAYRGMAGRKRAVRKLEYNAWLDMRRERQVILFALHVSVFLYIFFALYINLLYGKWWTCVVARRPTPTLMVCAQACTLTRRWQRHGCWPP